MVPSLQAHAALPEDSHHPRPAAPDKQKFVPARGLFGRIIDASGTADPSSGVRKVEKGFSTVIGWRPGLCIGKPKEACSTLQAIFPKGETTFRRNKIKGGTPGPLDAAWLISWVGVDRGLFGGHGGGTGEAGENGRKTQESSGWL